MYLVSSTVRNLTPVIPSTFIYLICIPVCSQFPDPWTFLTLVPLHMWPHRLTCSWFLWLHFKVIFNYFLFSRFLYCLGLPRFSSQPEPSSVYVGNSAILNCEVNADLVPFVRWEQNRQPLLLDDRLTKLPSGTLVISNATEGDGGLYRCIVESGGPPKYSDEVELKVLPGISLLSALMVLCLLTDKNCSVRIFFNKHC